MYIHDTGYGIPKENLSKIFNLAYTTKGIEGGTDLGLFVVKELANRLGIGISVDSEIGRGTGINLRFDCF